MKHQRTPIIIEDSSDDESLSLGPLPKRQKKGVMAPALTLESLIRAGEVLRQEDSKSKSRQESLPGRVTPTKELLQDKAEDLPLNRACELVRTALSDTLAAIKDPPKPARSVIPRSLPALKANDWRKFCRPLAAPPRLPNVPCGSSVVNEKRAIPT